MVGSIGFDLIFGIHGDIRNEIPFDKSSANKLNLMFTAKNKRLFYGGTGGNIAYGLGILKKPTILFSVVGQDFYEKYHPHLENLGIEVKVHCPGTDSYTATFYGISDEQLQQIGIWQPNAYGDHIELIKLDKTLNNVDFNSIRVAIFSPGTGISTLNHMKECRKKCRDATLIFDPSQVLSIFYNKNLLDECVNLSDIVIGNETEIKQFESMFNLKPEDLLGSGVKYVIETLGAKGSRIYSRQGVIHIPAHKPKHVTETTGAGDAFRAGLISGLLDNLNIKEAAGIGAKMGALSVEEFGGQGYKIQ